MFCVFIIYLDFLSKCKCLKMHILNIICMTLFFFFPVNLLKGVQNKFLYSKSCYNKPCFKEVVVYVQKHDAPCKHLPIRCKLLQTVLQQYHFAFLSLLGLRWLSGRASDSGERAPGFESHDRCIVSLNTLL